MKKREMEMKKRGMEMKKKDARKEIIEKKMIQMKKREMDRGMMELKVNEIGRGLGISVVLIMFLVLLVNLVIAVDPVGPGSLNITNNETNSGSSSGSMVNISGGYIATINLTSTIQNPRWKGFVGTVDGKFALRDVSGSTIYDWALTVTTSRIYATRNSSTINWTGVNCSNVTYLEAENIAMNHSNVDDNITATFAGTNHSSFWVGGVSIAEDLCPTTNTYIANVTQGNDFEEMVLYDGISTVYVAVSENSLAGFDGGSYDFQMLVPEVGLAGWGGATAYYIYVEIG